MENKILNILKTSDKYDLTLFSKRNISKIEKSILLKNKKYYLKCPIRDKEIQAKPEEIIQQLYLDKLLNEFNYPKDLIRVLYPITFGREKKQADLVILDKTDKSSIYCVVEIKKHKEKDGKEQLKSYTNATGAPLAIWTNGSEINIFERVDPNYFEPISRLYNEEIEDVKNQKFTYLDLMKNDRLTKERKSLKKYILDMEDEVLANAGVDIFEEVFKLIFTKLYDEIESARDRLDSACGSCGFTIHTLFNIWEKLENKGGAQFSNFSNQELTPEQKAVVDNVFGIDFDEKAVRTSRTLNMIAGDGKTNVLHLNTLDYSRWNEKKRMIPGPEPTRKDTLPTTLNKKTMKYLWR